MRMQGELSFPLQEGYNDPIFGDAEGGFAHQLEECE